MRSAEPGDVQEYGCTGIHHVLFRNHRICPEVMTYCNAGHNPPILVSTTSLTDSTRRLDCGGGILGMFRDWTYNDGEVWLRSGDRVLLYTDGITDSRNSAGEEFGEKRLFDLILRTQNLDAAALANEAIQAASRFSNGIFDQTDSTRTAPLREKVSSLCDDSGCAARTTDAVTLVPAPGIDVMLNNPPTCRIRSAIPERPVLTFHRLP